MSDAFTTHGACSWIELHTRDLTQSKAFYCELLGWVVEPMAMGDGKEYQLIKVGDAGIGGMVEEADVSIGNGGWAIYVTVNDIDARLDKVAALGGQVSIPAFDVPGVGRMAGIQDPTGASMMLISYEK